MFAASVSVTLGDGASARFWTDCWLPEGAISVIAPDLFGAVARRARTRSVRNALHQSRWVLDITGALTAAVLY